MLNRVNYGSFSGNLLYLNLSHRLNYGGNRDANRALHMIAVCRLRHCDRTRTYAERRTAEGKTSREIKRCLARYVARDLYRLLEDGAAAA